MLQISYVKCFDRFGLGSRHACTAEPFVFIWKCQDLVALDGKPFPAKVTLDHITPQLRHETMAKQPNLKIDFAESDNFKGLFTWAIFTAIFSV